MTAVQDFKAFLRRHPEIHGPTRTEQLLDDIRAKIEHMCRGFINERYAGPETLNCMVYTIKDALQQMVNGRFIENFDIHDATRPLDPHSTLEIFIQPALTVERAVVTVTINP